MQCRVSEEKEVLYRLQDEVTLALCQLSLLTLFFLSGDRGGGAGGAIGSNSSSLSLGGGGRERRWSLFSLSSGRRGRERS